MITFTLPSPTTLPAHSLSLSPTRRPNLLQAWLYSFLIYVLPHRTRKQWLKISTLQAIVVAFINLLLVPLWFLLLDAAYFAHENNQLRVHLALMGEFVPHPVIAFFKIVGNVPHDLYNDWNHPSPFQSFEHLAVVVGASLSTITAFAILYFVLLPFAAKPGPNKPAALHNLRAVLLSSGWIHVWFPILTATFLFFIFNRIPPVLENYLPPLAAVLILLTLWTLLALISAVRADYRNAPQHFPQPHDPWCEECGYNLVASDPLSRCPECGTPIPQSLGAHARPPTPWEQNPSLLNLKSIRHQIAQLYSHPRQLFFSMPTLSGQPAAQRWLLASATATGLLAALILPVGKILNIFVVESYGNLLFGSLFVGLTWAILALMMVGIETAGIATFSKLRAKREAPGGPGGVYLAASAKVTAYSSTLMLPWVILGGAQLLAAQYWDLNHFTQHHHLSLRTEQILLAGSLSLAHIGGLLWYELTVYRGIKAIQYANK